MINKKTRKNELVTKNTKLTQKCQIETEIELKYSPIPRCNNAKGQF